MATRSGRGRSEVTGQKSEIKRQRADRGEQRVEERQKTPNAQHLMKQKSEIRADGSRMNLEWQIVAVSSVISALSAVRIRFKLAEERFHRLFHVHPWLPSQTLAKLLVGIPVTFPIGSAAAAVEDWRELPF